MATRFGPAIAALLMVVVSGCGHSHSVMVPPRIDLKQHEVVGVIDFDCSAESNEGELAQLVTGRFIDAARRDQGLVRFVRLGPETEVLRDLGLSRLDPEACKALGEKHGVRTLVRGSLAISDVRPNISIMQSLTRVGVSADVQATLTVEMIETASGASVWSQSAGATQRVGALSISTAKDVSLHAADPEKAYGSLADNLVWAVTHDFRVTWQRVK
jgi:hypothetical protein